MLNRIFIYVAISLVVGLIKIITTNVNKNKLGEPELILSKEERSPEFFSSLIGALIWICIFIYDLFTNTISPSDNTLFTIILGVMTGITINSIFTTKFMPSGFYKNGVLTETNLILYEQIQGYSQSTVPKKPYKKLTFQRINNNKNSFLFISNTDEKDVMKILRSKKIS